jgi:DNA-binding PadR family transcriptional regulator
MHRLVADGLLTSEAVRENGRSRKYYGITRKGRLALSRIRPKLKELVSEV